MNGLSMTCDMSVVLKMVLNTITLTLKKNGEKRGHFNPLKKKNVVKSTPTVTRVKLDRVQ